LLHTLESLGWISRDQGDTYRLGSHYGFMGNAFLQQFDMIHIFRREAMGSVDRLHESVQLAKLEGAEIVYLDKLASSSPIQMVSGPGAKLHAHATGLGKVLLSGIPEADLHVLLPEEDLPALTPYTITRKDDLLAKLAEIRKQGYAYDLQEAVLGFNCIAAPVYGADRRMMAAVSISIPIHHWEEKKEKALVEIVSLAERMSLNKG